MDAYELARACFEAYWDGTPPTAFEHLSTLSMVSWQRAAEAAGAAAIRRTIERVTAKLIADGEK